MFVLAAPVELAGLRVLAIGDTPQRLLGHGARLLGTEHFAEPEQQPPGGTAVTILHHPGAQHLAASAEAQAVTETGYAVVEDDDIGLAGRQVSAATALAVSFIYPPGKRQGSSRQAIGGRCWHNRKEEIAH